MNKSEYYNGNDNRNKYYYHVHKLLKDWKIENNIPTSKRCIVHHRDDTEECHKYNEEHYELWGCNEDGTFEYGKYVLFMTVSEHMRYHNAGVNNPMYDVHKFGVDNPFYGRVHSSESKEKMHMAHTGKALSNVHKSKIAAAHTGKQHTDETKAKISASRKGIYPSDDTKVKMSLAQSGISLLWKVYKNNNGKLSYNEFRRALKNGNITFESQPITLLTK